MNIRPYQIMGILNVTPDSFHDGGCYQTIDQAVSHAKQMLEAGAAIIDVGGESTRPGASSVSVAEELNRVLPVIDQLTHLNCFVSVDTSKPEVMRQAIAHGAKLVNDVRALTEAGAKQVIATTGVLACLVHHQPVQSMRQIVVELQTMITDCLAAGIKREQLIIDPGFGFGKKGKQNIQLLQDLTELKTLKLPILVGLSRKSMTLAESVAAARMAIEQGADIIRVHEVEPYQSIMPLPVG